RPRRAPASAWLPSLSPHNTLRWRHGHCADEWEDDGKGRPRSPHALDTNRAPMPFDDLRSDIQADPEAGIGLLRWVADTVELLEKVLLVPLGDADSEVLHGDDRVAILVSQADDGGARLGRVLDGVRQQVRHFLPKAFGNPPDGGIHGA